MGSPPGHAGYLDPGAPIGDGEGHIFEYAGRIDLVPDLGDSAGPHLFGAPSQDFHTFLQIDGNNRDEAQEIKAVLRYRDASQGDGSIRGFSFGEVEFGLSLQGQVIGLVDGPAAWEKQEKGGEEGFSKHRGPGGKDSLFFFGWNLLANPCFSFPHFPAWGGSYFRREMRFHQA